MKISEACEKHHQNYTRNIEARSRNDRCRGKAINITYPELMFVALVIQHAKRMHYIILPPVACLILQHSYTYLVIFVKKKKVILHKMCVLIFSTHFACSISHSM
jgi:hypothetical protein